MLNWQVVLVGLLIMAGILTTMFYTGMFMHGD